MTILPAIQISVFVISFVLIALFCAAEAAFTSVNRMSVMEHADQGGRRALIADRLLEDRTRLITVLLVGINIFTVIPCASRWPWLRCCRLWPACSCLWRGRLARSQGSWWRRRRHQKTICR